MKLKIAIIIVVTISILSSTFNGNSQSDISEIELINPYGSSTNNYLSLKGQLHAHSTNSRDGGNSYSPQVMAEMYRNLGYDFLTITDHNKITSDPQVPGITWIGNSVEETREKHYTVYDIEDIMTDETGIQNIINSYFGRNKLVSLAHPSWSVQLYQIQDVNNYYNYSMIEVYNGIIAAYASQNDDAYWDEALKKQNIWGIATDDFHKPGQEDKGWVEVFAENNTKEDILNALRSGRFYASSGNDLSINVNNNVIGVSSTEESRFFFIGENGVVLKEEGNVFESSYVVTGAEKYVRVRAEREDGLGMAWSQPIRITRYYYYMAGVDGYR